MSHRKSVYLVLCFEAGLATGLSRFLDPWITAFLLGAGALVLRRSGTAWLAGAALLGLGLGVITRAGEAARCVSSLPAGVIRTRIEFRQPVSQGVAGAAVMGPCRGLIPVRVRSPETVAAGSRWEVTGRWLPSRRFGGKPDGLLIISRMEPRGAAGGWEPELRNWLHRTITRLYGARSGLVDALLTGSRGDLDPALKAEFARSGLIHLLAISGFHVGIFFGWTVLLLKAVGAGRARRSLAAAAMAFGYVAFLGWPAPATRAALLCGLGAWSASRQRHPAPLALLGVTCLLVTLLDPWAIFDLGAWLSAGAFYGTMTFTRWSDRFIGTAAGWRMLFASLGATLTTAPFTAAALGTVALAGIALNFAAIPLAALAVPATLLSVLLAAVFPPAASGFAAGAGLGLAGLEALAHHGSRIPAGALMTPEGPGGALPWALLLGFALWVLGRRNTGRRAALRLGLGLGIAGILLLLPLPRAGSTYGSGGLSLHFLGVGQGDAALIRTPGGRWILVDGGPADGRRNAGREVVLPFLVRQGVRRLDLVVLSHAHLDHVGGIPAVLERVPASLILEPARPVAEPNYLRMLELAEREGTRWRPGRAGDSLVIDGVVLRVLHPDTAWTRWNEDLNDDSVVLLVRYGAFEAVLAGDLGIRAEAWLAGRVGAVDLLKVGHHGSAGSTGTGWLAELAPRAAVISVGPNRYGHPAPGALARLTGQGTAVWRTDREGSVTVTLDQSTMVLRGRSRTARYELVP